MSKTKLTKNNEMGVQRFTADITNCIQTLEPILTDAFESIRKGEIGAGPREPVLKLFDEWLYRSNLPKVEDANKYLQKVLAKWESRVERIRLEAKKNLVGLGNLDNLIVEITSKIAKGNKISDAVSEGIWTAYITQTRNFMLQTAHLIVSRLLMYLVGVDKKAWAPLVVQHVEKPYLQFYWNLRSSMSDFLPGLYFLNEFDWFYLPDTMRQGLSPGQKRVLEALENKLDITVGRFFKEINDQYDYTEMNVDVWSSVYQKFLSYEDINKLGFVTTPNEIVDLILDLIEYTSSKDGLCKKTILDPACGSGTFLVEALVRLKEHLQTRMKCHDFDERKPIWERDKQIIENITSNLHGIDIHPFATFLTTTNLAFQLIENYSIVRHKYPEYSLEFNVATHDALARSPPFTKALPTDNGRIREAVRRSEKYARLCNQKFDYVVGNPPWGSILKGGIGPLGDKKIKLDYKARFTSAYDKYDIFVLFMERGIKWTNRDGAVGMITQNTWPSARFGDGIKKVIRERTAVEYLIDLGTLGNILFPQRTNYPAITVLRNAPSREEPKVVEVTEK
jgi:type I restriction-modification system DNA methylase subunit